MNIPPSRNSYLDEYWINTVLTVIGEGFGPNDSDDIAGIVMNRKKGNDRIAIWTKTALNKSLQESIGRRWRETTNIAMRMEYTAFKDAMGGGRSGKKVRYNIG